MIRHLEGSRFQLAVNVTSGATVVLKTPPYRGLYDSGTAESGTTATLVDTDKAWTVNAFAGKYVVITGGTGVGQIRRIISNTSTQLTVTHLFLTAPGGTSVYQIVDGQGMRPVITSFTITGGGTGAGSVLVHSNDGTVVQASATTLLRAYNVANGTFHAHNGDIRIEGPANGDLEITAPTNVVADIVIEGMWLTAATPLQ